MSRKRNTPSLKSKTTKATYALWLQKARLSVPMTQAQLAVSLGWHPQSFTRWENAKRNDDVPVAVLYAVHGLTGYALPAELRAGGD